MDKEELKDMLIEKVILLQDRKWQEKLIDVYFRYTELLERNLDLSSRMANYSKFIWNLKALKFPNNSVCQN